MVSEAKHTPGPWHPGHFVDDSHTCDCRSVISECYAGAICSVEVNNGLSITDGGNDAPPLEEAKANALLIAAAPDLFNALELAAHFISNGIEFGFIRMPENDPSNETVARIRAALSKAKATP